MNIWFIFYCLRVYVLYTEFWASYRMCLHVLRQVFSFLLFCFNRDKLITVIKKAIQLIHSNCNIEFGHEIDVLFMLIKGVCVLSMV